MIRPTHRLRAFTLIELLVVISVIALLIAILLPALASARKVAIQVQCLTNLRQLNTASFNYAADSKGKFPPVKGGQIYGIASEKFSYGLGLLTNNYIPATQRGDNKGSVWICPAETATIWLNNAPWTWDVTQDRAQWRGTYWLPYRTWHPDKPGQARNPVWYYGNTLYWPSMNVDDGPYVWLHDGLTSGDSSGNSVGRKTRHERGYNAVYMDGSGTFFGGTAADTIDTIVLPFINSVETVPSFQAMTNFFDVQRNVGNYPSGPS